MSDPIQPLSSAPAPLSGPIPTVWSGDGILAGWNLADDLLVAAQPPAVQLHTWEPDRVASLVRRAIPGVQIVVGVGIDGVARHVAKGEWSVARGADTLRDLAARARNVGARAICWNAEAAWKTPPTTTQRERLVALVREAILQVAASGPPLEQWHTAYDHPTYHSEYPWEAWLGAGSPIRVSLPQVYAAPGDGLIAHRGALPAREARALASWASAVRKGVIRPDAPEGTAADLTDCDWRPYYQLHSVKLADTCASAVRHPFVALWALPTRSDKEGRAAFLALCVLHREGYWGDGAIQRWQTARGLTADGSVGSLTLATMGIAL